jgi:hypothetical protein
MKRTRTSKAQKDVWKWKETAYLEVKDMDLTDAIRDRIRTSARTAEALGFQPIKTKKRFVAK